MCLTEAGAGSDVGANNAKAVKVADDTYELTGEKIFISSGDHDFTDNIIHLVLARTPGADEGTKGLSIFLVPKFMFDADGNLGERNGIFVSGIEEKMGIHGSATCRTRHEPIVSVLAIYSAMSNKASKSCST